MVRIIAANIAKSIVEKIDPGLFFDPPRIGYSHPTGDIRVLKFTSSSEGDSSVVPELLSQIPPDEYIGTLTGDGAFDTPRCNAAIPDRGSTVIIAISRNGRLWKQDWPAARAREDMLHARPGSSVAPAGSN